MDPNSRGPEGMSQDDDGQGPRQRPPRDSLTPDFAQHAPALARTVQLVTGDFLLTVNPVDGSEIEVCPPAERPGRPRKRTADERADVERAAAAPVPPGPGQSTWPLLERQNEREQLVRLLARGRSVRLTGPAGSGRTSLLALVADDCADLAPDGVVRLSGFRRTAAELLHDLFHAVHDAPLHRPGQDELLECVREIGAVVVIDDIEVGGSALDELLDATPECAFLLGATPDVPAPSADSDVEEVVLAGLDRAGGVEVIERAAGRVLTEEESNWAGDLWFESEGLPLRFVQAGALLRQHDQLRASADAVDEYGVFEDAPPADLPLDGGGAAAGVPLPPLGEAAAPAPLLASRLSASARTTLRFAVALGGEVPHQAHLPALVGDTHADAALGELAACGLVSPVGSRYRLAAGVLTQLEAAGYGDDAEERARAAAQHYAWWAGHPSVTPERVCGEADALLASLSALVQASRPGGQDGESPAVRVARTAAPAFAAGLHWSAWERALRSGAEAARLAGQVAEQAYFHHELGILALCGGALDRARAELEASIGLRGALADKRGTVAGRRALALVADRSGAAPGFAAMAGLGMRPGEEEPDPRGEEPATPAGGAPTPFPTLQPPAAGPSTPVAYRVPNVPGPSGPKAAAASEQRLGVKKLARRNLVAAGAGALLVAVLGTVVTLGASGHNDADDPSHKVNVNPSASQDLDDGSLGGDVPGQGGGSGGGDTGVATSRPTDPGPDGTYGTPDDPAPAAHTAQPSDEPTGTRRPGGSGGDAGSASESPSRPSSTRPTPPAPTHSSPSPSPSENAPSPSPTQSQTAPSDPGTPSTSDSASGPSTASATATSSSSAGAPETGGSTSGSDQVI
ncbi:ATP-binding protein [Streptomyces sp. NPDC046831]|uniref:ATP-binding protein n=1 Tax=Streptomyces sp. NPDC046831 TaxID=3154805 RepID=UPI003409D5BE